MSAPARKEALAALEVSSLQKLSSAKADESDSGNEISAAHAASWFWLAVMPPEASAEGFDGAGVWSPGSGTSKPPALNSFWLLVGFVDGCFVAGNDGGSYGLLLMKCSWSLTDVLSTLVLVWLLTTDMVVDALMVLVAPSLVMKVRLGIMES